MNTTKFCKNIISGFGVMMFVAVGAISMLANHPVLVEGNCNVPPAGSSSVITPGTCGDYDGDGKIGTAEDTDGDQVFGTISGANSATGVNNNGTITIVTSGTFPEQIILRGNVTLQAAPGVDANIDAVLQGDPGSTARQGQTGILVNAQANRYVVIRNITIRNWASGIQVVSSSRVAIENCILEHNVNYGIVVRDSASVKIDQSEVIATGFRLDPATGDFPSANNPNPGIGISFEAQSRGAVFRTEVSGSLTVGISDRSIRSVKVDDVYLFDNTVDLENIKGKVR
ncbi:MAG: right-handed parallel beta-helix repeat-containing protein [Pyrinomonadaceae bacterium]